MKKKYILLFILVVTFAVSNRLYSQNIGEKIKTKSKWNYGIAAGPQFTNISSPGTPESPENGVGFFAGIFGEYMLADKLKVRMGVDYDRRNFSVAFRSQFLVFQDSIISQKSYSAYDLSYNVNYLTLPLSLIYVTGGDKFKMFVRGTFYYSVFLSAHKKGYTDIYIDENDFQYVDQELYPELQIGHNRKDYDESTDTFFSTERFNSNDLGLSFFIGGIYKMSEKVELYLSPGFTSSFGRVLENPIYDSKWIQVLKIETGIVINLN